MFNSLPHGIKISITRSISAAFEQYMKNIQWDEKQYNLEDFIKYWREYAEKNASWFDKIGEEMKANSQFHEELAAKINETIEKVLTEAPTEEQMAKLDSLIKELGMDDIDYTCKTEAKYHIDRLKSMLTK
jgi:predicted transcriptional regulator